MRLILEVCCSFKVEELWKTAHILWLVISAVYAILKPITVNKTAILPDGCYSGGWEWQRQIKTWRNGILSVWQMGWVNSLGSTFHVETWIWGDIGSDYLNWCWFIIRKVGPVTSTWEQFYKIYPSHQSLKFAAKLFIFIQISLWSTSKKERQIF